MSEQTTGVDTQMLLERIAALEAQLAPKPAADTKMLDINDVRVPYKFQKFPLTLYKASAQKNQADHPGNKTTHAKSEGQLEQLLADGWQLEPLPPPDPEAAAVDEAPVSKKGKK